MTDDQKAGHTRRARGGRRSSLEPRELAILGHEIRGPLGVMSTLAELLLERDLAPADRHLVELIRLAGAHVLGIAEDLVAEGSLGTGRLRVTPEPFAPKDLLDALCSLWMPTLDGAERRVGVTIDPGAPAAIIADKGRIQQILFNLVANAAKASADCRIELSVAAGAEPGRVIFDVSDDGSGLPAGYDIEPFGTGRGQGAGLGLWISSRIAEALGGSLTLEAREPGGTRARLELPVDAAVQSVPQAAKRPRAKRRKSETAAPAKAAAVAALDRMTSPPAASPLAGISVLVVDDSSVSCMLMTTVLTSFGMHVTTAASGEEAMVIAGTGEPDLVLLDWSLPQETGADVLFRLTEKFGDRLPPVVAVSGMARVPAAAIAGHVRKPFTPRELYTAIETALHGQMLMEAAT